MSLMDWILAAIGIAGVVAGFGGLCYIVLDDALAARQEEQKEL